MPDTREFLLRWAMAGFPELSNSERTDRPMTNTGNYLAAQERLDHAVRAATDAFNLAIRKAHRVGPRADPERAAMSIAANFEAMTLADLLAIIDPSRGQHWRAQARVYEHQAESRRTLLRADLLTLERDAATGRRARRAGVV